MKEQSIEAIAVEPKSTRNMRGNVQFATKVLVYRSKNVNIKENEHYGMLYPPDQPAIYHLLSSLLILFMATLCNFYVSTR